MFSSERHKLIIERNLFLNSASKFKLKVYDCRFSRALVIHSISLLESMEKTCDVFNEQRRFSAFNIHSPVTTFETHLKLCRAHFRLIRRG